MHAKIRQQVRVLVFAAAAGLLGGCDRVADTFFRLRGDAYRQADKPDAALRNYQRLLTNGNDVAVLRRMAECYAALHDQTNLVSLHRRIYAATTNTLDLNALIWVELEQKDYAGARADIECMIAAEPDNWLYRDLLVTTLRENSASNEIGRVLNHFAATLPPTASNLLHQAELWAENGELTNAIAALIRALKLEPDNFDWRIALAALQVDAAQYGAGISNLLDVCAARPADADARQMLGYAYGQSGDRRAAVDHFRACIRLDQRNTLALNNLAYFLLLQNTNIAEALELAQSAVQLHRASYTLDTLAYAYYRKGAFDTALRYLHEAERSSRTEGVTPDPEMDFHFGLVHAERGEMDKALPRFRAALARQPELEQILAGERYYLVLKERLRTKAP